jgi:hypothetical protein
MKTLTVLLLLLASTVSAAEAKKMLLLNVSGGEMPGDASAQVALSEEHPQKPGGVTLKVTFAGSAFGQSKNRNWAGYRWMKFYAFNPGDKPVAAYLATRDKDTTGWETRGDIGCNIAPGANNVAIDLGALKRNQSPKPMDLSALTSWYIASEAKEPVFLGDLWLEGEGGAAPKAEGTAKTEGAPVRLEGTVQGKKIVLEGRIRLELDVVKIEGVAEGGAAETKPQPAAPTAPAAPAAQGGERKMLLDTNAGELTQDHSAPCALSVDHAKELGGKSMKVDFKAGTAFGVGYWGAVGPSNWEGYASFRCEAFNPTDQVLSLGLVIRDKKTGYENRADLSFRLTPGLNKVSVPIQALVSNAGAPLDRASISHWYIACDKDVSLYFANFRLEKE